MLLQRLCLRTEKNKLTIQNTHHMHMYLFIFIFFFSRTEPLRAALPLVQDLSS